MKTKLTNIIKTILGSPQIFVEFLFSGRRTKPIELLNSLIGMSFSSSFIIYNGIINNFYPYRNFMYVANIWIWMVVLLLSSIQLRLIFSNTIKSSLKVAMLHLWFSLVWIIIAVIFGTDFPPVSTAFGTYFSLSMINFVSYLYLDNNNKARAKISTRE